MARILVISGDILPYGGFPTSGAGLRAWSIGKGLESKGHEVLLAMPRMAVPPKSVIPENLRGLLYVHRDLTSFISHHHPEIVILQHWLLASHLQKHLELPLVIDLHGPLLLEKQFQGSPGLDALKHKKLRALRRADLFTCAGERQRYYFEAWLLMAGFDLRNEMVRTIPVSMSPDIPTPDKPQECTFVYGGMFLPWQNPALSLITLKNCLEANRKGILKVWGGNHPVLKFPVPEFTRLIEQLKDSPRAQVHSIISRDQLIQEYLCAHVAIDLMEQNVERELAFTTRTVEYLWCGLPVIYNNYGELSKYIQDYRAGWTIDPKNTPELRKVIEEILYHPEYMAERSRNAQRLVREQLTWDKTIEPLDAFCRHPVQSGKRKSLPPFTTCFSCETI